jgi:hypothetical protein
MTKDTILGKFAVRLPRDAFALTAPGFSLLSMVLSPFSLFCLDTDLRADLQPGAIPESIATT